MAAERLFSLVLLLQARSPRSAGELARTLEVSPRTIYRDMDALSAAGIPVYAERGRDGGIALADGYRHAIAQFGTDELHALFARASNPLADLGVAEREGALRKLAGALPPSQRRAAELAQERVLIDHNRWYRSDQPVPILAGLRRAVWSEHAVRISYRDRMGAATTRVVEPLGLVSKAGVWYVVARQRDGEMRTFRAERITQAIELPQGFERPRDFDLQRYWQSSQRAIERPVPDERFEATLDARDEMVDRVCAFIDVLAVSDRGAGKRLHVRFASRRNAVSQLAALGAGVRVVDPLDLAADITRHARELLQAYGDM